MECEAQEKLLGNFGFHSIDNDFEFFVFEHCEQKGMLEHGLDLFSLSGSFWDDFGLEGADGVELPESFSTDAVSSQFFLSFFDGFDCDRFNVLVFAGFVALEKGRKLRGQEGGFQREMLLRFPFLLGSSSLLFCLYCEIVYCLWSFLI